MTTDRCTARRFTAPLFAALLLVACGGSVPPTPGPPPPEYWEICVTHGLISLFNFNEVPTTYVILGDKESDRVKGTQPEWKGACLPLAAAELRAGGIREEIWRVPMEAAPDVLLQSESLGFPDGIPGDSADKEYTFTQQDGSVVKLTVHFQRIS